MKFRRITANDPRYYLSQARGLLGLPFYKHVYRRRILSTRGVVCDPRAPLEIHALTCDRDYIDLIWCLKTFSHYSRLPFHLVIHDDGSLAADALETLSRHFLNSLIIGKARADEEMSGVLGPHARCRKLRADLVLAKKLLDFPHFASRDRFLLLDSDILFFSYPAHMVRAIEEGRSFFMSDYQNAYVYRLDELKAVYGMDVIEKFNSGLSFLEKRLLDYAAIEDLSGRLKEEDYGHAWAEQTLIALLASQSGRPHERLPGAYQISRQAIGAQTISHHFVNDGSRRRFYHDGLRFLRETGFLDSFDAGR